MDRSSNRRVHRRNSKYSPGVGRVVRSDENVSRSSPALSNDEEKREREKFSDFMGKIRERRELSERESLDGQL